jgi:hypothetical protein
MSHVKNYLNVFTVLDFYFYLLIIIIILFFVMFHLTGFKTQSSKTRTKVIYGQQYIFCSLLLKIFTFLSNEFKSKTIEMRTDLLVVSQIN